TTGTGTLNGEFDTNTINLGGGLFSDWTSGKGSGIGGGGYDNQSLGSIAFSTMAGNPLGTGNDWTVAFADPSTSVISFTAPINGAILQTPTQVAPEPSTWIMGFA